MGLISSIENETEKAQLCLPRPDCGAGTAFSLPRRGQPPLSTLQVLSLQNRMRHLPIRNLCVSPSQRLSFL